MARKPLYPAHWAWDVEDPFSLIQTDAKDILDKGALGTERTTHLRRQGLPRYQWTACDARTRLRNAARRSAVRYTWRAVVGRTLPLFLEGLGISHRRVLRSSEEPREAVPVRKARDAVRERRAVRAREAAAVSV